MVVVASLAKGSLPLRFPVDPNTRRLARSQRSVRARSGDAAHLAAHHERPVLGRSPILDPYAALYATRASEVYRTVCRVGEDAKDKMTSLLHRIGREYERAWKVSPMLTLAVVNGALAVSLFASSAV